MKNSHEAKVQRVRDALLKRPPGSTVSTKRSSVTHQVRDTAYKKNCYLVDVSDFTDILSIEQGRNSRGEDAMVAVCEGLVTVEALVQRVLPMGYVPEVVPEFPLFTVAGLINGEGIQTSSFRYGVFSNTVASMELVLGNGDICTVSRTVEPELFQHMIESYGTLAIVVAATVSLRPSMPYVRTRYTVSTTLADFVHTLDAKVRKQQGDFLEGLVFAADQYVIVESHFCPDAGDESHRFDPMPFDTDKGEIYYYQYIRKYVLGREKRTTDVIPTHSFLFRSYRGLYWIIECRIGAKFLSDMAWMRRYCDRKVRDIYRQQGFKPAGKLTTDELSRCLVHQDLGVRLERLETGISAVQRLLGVYPLWICPVFSQSHCFVCDIGVYGEPTVQPFKHKKVMVEVQKVMDVVSKWGIAYTDREAIRAHWAPIRQKYHAEGVFVPLETKVMDKSNDSLETGPIPCWRLVDDYGWYWWVKGLIIFALLLSAVAVFIFFLV